MGSWENIILLILAGALVFFFLPGTKRMLKESPKAKKEDWMGLSFIIGIVVLFVLFLIVMVR